MKKEEKKTERVKNAVLKAADFVKGRWIWFTSCLMAAMTNPAFASKAKNATEGAKEVTENTGAEMWNSIVSTLATWIQVLGAFILVWGGIMIGLSFQSDDPNQRTNGIRTLIAGVIVIAIISIGKGYLQAG